MVRPEHVVCFFRGALEDDYHEGAHKERSINHLVGLFRRAVMENAVLRIILVLQESSQLTRKPVHHSKVERPEIFIEREVRQVVVNVEEKGVLVILRWVCSRHPVEFVLDNLDRTADDLGSVNHFLDRTCTALDVLITRLLDGARVVFFVTHFCIVKSLRWDLRNF